MTSFVASRRISPIGAFLAVIIGLTTLQTAHAEEAPSFEQVQKWVREEWNRARLYPPIAGFYIEYEREFHEPLPTLQQVENLRRVVAGKPDHPNWPKLKEYEILLKDGCKRETYRIWSEGSGRFRRSADHHYSEESHPFFDLVVLAHEDSSWTLSRTELGVYSPASGFPENRNYEAYERGFEYQLGQIFYGALNTLSSPDIVPSSFGAHDSSVRLTIGSTVDGTSATVTMTWDHLAGRGFVDDLRFVSASGDYSGRRLQFAGWTMDPELQVWRASAVTEFNLDESVRTLLRYSRTHMMNDTEFAEVTTPPTPLRTDPVRGAVAYTTFVDYRDANRPHRIAVERNGNASAAATQAILSATMASKWRSKGMIVGAIVVGIGVLIVFLVLRHVRRSHFT